MASITLRDYAHASKVFRSNNFELTPKYKWLFHVNFVTNASIADAGKLSYLVRSVELPKFTPTVKDMNQYNRRIWAQTQIKYDPVSIKFNDDNVDNIRTFWQKYYNYYFRDGKYNSSVYNNDDRYQGRNASQWGLDNDIQVDYLEKIEIYSIHGKDASKITLWSPIISNFVHDQHDNYDYQGLMEATMSIHYTAVTYDTGKAAGIAGFGDPEHYDDSSSPLNSGSAISSSDGSVTSQFNSLSGSTSGTATNSITDNRLRPYNPYTGAVLTDQQIQNINNNQKPYSNNGFNFPVIDQNGLIYSSNRTETVPYPTTTNTNATRLSQSYVSNSWQSVLANKGFTYAQISSAELYISSISGSLTNTTNLIQLAEQYISNPNSIDLVNVTYGRYPVQSQINKSNPLQNVQPVYNSNDWKQILRNKGYTDADIRIASNQIASLNISPAADLASIAEQYIQFNKKIQSQSV